jgi:hypothetical protein
LLKFDSAKTETIAGVAQIPHGWLKDSGIRPHIHICGNYSDPTAGSADVVWKLEYDWINNAEGWTIATYPYNETLTFTLPSHEAASTPTQTIGSFTEIAGTNKTASSLFIWRLSRVGGDAADTYADDCYLMEFDIHYLMHKFGTETEF